MQPPTKNDAFILSKEQIKKVFLATSILIFALYLVAMVFSLCGSKYFILNYQNTQMDNIEQWFRNRHIYGFINILFSAIEFFIIISFIIKKVPNILYAIGFYAVGVLVAFFFDYDWVYTVYPILFYLTIPLIEQLRINKKINFKEYAESLLRLVISIVITLILQAMLLVIKSGNFDFRYVPMNLSATFIYAIEYDIALLVIYYTVSLYINREKGDSQLWATDTAPGGSSQTSRTQLLKSNTKKNLTKTQRNKLHWLYTKMYLIQLGTLLLVMALPFLLGKVFEFAVMYLSFAIVRYILGFKYSLHFKKEALCVSASLIVFGILSLAVPFFYIVLVYAVLMGCLLAILLHLSYKYKSLWLFKQAAKVDKFATLYVFFDGDLSEHHINVLCYHKGLDGIQSSLIKNFMKGEKLSYLAFKYNYSQRMIIYKLDEAIEKLLS